MKGYNKWNKKHVINPKTHEYAFRKLLLDFITQKQAKTVIEVGPGALVEYNLIKQKFPNIAYTISDVSDRILSKVSIRYPDIRRIESTIENLDSKVGVKEFDISYVSHVFEHTNNPKKAIKNTIASAKYFQFVFFKWRYNGDLTPSYRSRKAYWSSAFNIHMIEDEISRHGNIEKSFMCNNDTGVQTDFKEYSKKYKGSNDVHRTGHYLIYQGSSK